MEVICFDLTIFINCRHVCHKWHYKIAKALVVCLESKDFVQIRNSLIVLTKIIQFFPVIQNLATVIEKRIEKVGGEFLIRATENNRIFLSY